MIEVSYSWRFSCNRSGSFRQRVGDLFRRLASRVDGRISLALDIETTPQIPAAEVADCIRVGFGKIEAGLEDCVRTAALERVLAVHMKEIACHRAR